MLLISEGPLTDSNTVQRHTLRKDGVLDRKAGFLDRKRSASRPRKFEARGDSRSRGSKTDEVLSAGYHSEGVQLNSTLVPVTKPQLIFVILMKTCLINNCGQLIDALTGH